MVGDREIGELRRHLEHGDLVTLGEAVSRIWGGDRPHDLDVLAGVLLVARERYGSAAEALYRQYAPVLTAVREDDQSTVATLALRSKAVRGFEGGGAAEAFLHNQAAWLSATNRGFPQLLLAEDLVREERFAEARDLLRTAVDSATIGVRWYLTAALEEMLRCLVFLGELTLAFEYSRTLFGGCPGARGS